MRKSSRIVFALLAVISLVEGTSALTAQTVETVTPSSAPIADRTTVNIPSKVDRESMAKCMEESLLKEGHGARVRAQGIDGKTLTVRWSLMKSHFVYHFASEDRLIKKLQNAGFTVIHFDNGDRFWDQQIE